MKVKVINLMNCYLVLVFLALPSYLFSQSIERIIEQVADKTSKFTLKEYRASIVLINGMIIDEPNEGIPYYYRGCLKIKIGEEESALSDLKKANNLEPLNFTILSELFRLEFKLKNYAEVVGYARNIRLAISLGGYQFISNDYEQLIAQAYSLLKEPDKAVLSCNKILGNGVPSSAAIASNSDVVKLRGDSYYEMGRFEDAINDLSAYIDFWEEKKHENQFRASFAYLKRGLARKALGSHLLAIEDLSIALELGYPVSTLIYLERGKAYRLIRQFKKSIKDYMNIYIYTSNVGNVDLELARVYLDMKKKKRACYYLDNAKEGFSSIGRDTKEINELIKLNCK